MSTELQGSIMCDQERAKPTKFSQLTMPTIRKTKPTIELSVGITLPYHLKLTDILGIQTLCEENIGTDQGLHATEQKEETGDCQTNAPYLELHILGIATPDIRQRHDAEELRHTQIYCPL